MDPARARVVQGACYGAVARPVAPAAAARLPRRIQILSRDNGAGLSQDIELLRRTLTGAGCEVRVKAVGHYHSLRSKLRRVRGRSGEWVSRAFRRTTYKFDINIMLERVCPGFFGQARCNVLVPNPEWTRDIWIRYLDRFDLVLAKTRHAVPLFRELHVPTSWSGWTSFDRLDPSVRRERIFLHAPGASDTKGTRHLMELWARHPAWPTLHVVWRSSAACGAPAAANVRLTMERLDIASLRRLQNRCCFHVCPSRTEGYGHYIAEALSVGAVCVATDAPPMNELVTPARGILVAAHCAGRQNLAQLYDFEDDSMRAAIARCIAMPDRELAELGHAARAWFQENGRAFSGRVAAALGRLQPDRVRGR